MARQSTIRPKFLAATYAEKITKLRIYRLEDAEFGTFEDHGDWPWQLDGFNESTGECTVDVWNFPTHAKAVAALPDFAATYEFEAALDPKPFRHYSGLRWDIEKFGNDWLKFDPRPGYSQNREDYA